jgi:chromosome condensin MukBEF MukE localization factor
MENESKKDCDYNFLSYEAVENVFADLNYYLLSGKHIQAEDYHLFSVLEEYGNELTLFYKKLYKLKLVRDILDNTTYYYLDFFSAGKGQLADITRHISITEMQTIVALMLLDMYYAKYFERHKIVDWPQLRQIIEEGDNSKNYQRILFTENRPSYSLTEWRAAEQKFKTAIERFDKMGWVTKISDRSEPLKFEIKPAIHRIAGLYASELENFDQFAETFRPGDVK